MTWIWSLKGLSWWHVHIFLAEIGGQVVARVFEGLMVHGHLHTSQGYEDSVDMDGVMVFIRGCRAYMMGADMIGFLPSE